MTTAFNLARLPTEAAQGTAGLLLWPLRIGKTVATNTVDTAFKLIGANTEDDVGCGGGEKNGSVHEMASSNLDIAAMIYYYTELRSATKKKVKEFAATAIENYYAEKKEDEDNDVTCETLVRVLYDALKLVERTEATLRSLELSPEQTDPKMKALEEYQNSLVQLEHLRQRYYLDKGDIDVFKTYFDILSEPKTMTGIKSDTILYDSFIDSGFRLLVGGSEYNREIIDRIGNSESIRVHHIDDDFAYTSLNASGIVNGFSSEIVWAIVVDDNKKTITVVFRGSVNGADWLTNVQTNMVDFELPGYTSEEIKETQKFGKVHEGFYDYLFGKTMAGFNGSVKSKAEEIIGKLKEDFFDKPEYANYSLVVTGHSLGAALSTMFGVRAAALNDFPEGTMVTNVSFASPFVGDEDFRKEFVELEKSRKIRHLRVSNDEDIVPLIPNTTSPLPDGLKGYKHVGMNIRLYKSSSLFGPSYRRFYPKSDSFVDGIRNTAHNELLSLGLAALDLFDNHMSPEYWARLDDEETKKQLSKFTLDDLYGNKSVTGWDYHEKKVTASK